MFHAVKVSNGSQPLALLINYEAIQSSESVETCSSCNPLVMDARTLNCSCLITYCKVIFWVISFFVTVYRAFRTMQRSY